MGIIVGPIKSKYTPQQLAELRKRLPPPNPDIVKDDRAKYASEEDKELLMRMVDRKSADSSLQILEFLAQYEQEKQYMTVMEFKKYTPLFSQATANKIRAEKGGPEKLDRLVRDYWKQVNPFKELIIVDNLKNKTVVAVLPPSAITTPTIENTYSSRRLDNANAKINRQDDVISVEEGSREYEAMIREAITSDQSVKAIIDARNKTIETNKKLDQLRDEYYKDLAANTKNRPSQASGDTSSITISFSEDTEVFD